MKPQELRDQSVEELIAKKDEMKKALFNLHSEKRRAGKIDKPHQLREIKKAIARTNTILREKELAIR